MYGMGPWQNSCARGLNCWLGRCWKYCIGPANHARCETQSERCIQGGDGPPAVCVPTCDPLLQDCAMPDQACLGGPYDDFICIPEDVVLSEDAGTWGDPCEPAFKLCRPRYLCIDGLGRVDAPGCEQGPCCASLCHLDDEAPCMGEAEQCIPLYESPDHDRAHVGVCLVPDASGMPSDLR